MKKLRRNRKKGFTLIELIVVIAILGILAAILIPQFTGFQERARENAILAEARSVATAVTLTMLWRASGRITLARLTTLSKFLKAQKFWCLMADSLIGETDT